MPEPPERLVCLGHTEVGGLVDVVFSVLVFGVQITKRFQRNFITEQRRSGLSLRYHGMRISAFSSMGSKHQRHSEHISCLEYDLDVLLSLKLLFLQPLWS